MRATKAIAGCFLDMDFYGGFMFRFRGRVDYFKHATRKLHIFLLCIMNFAVRVVCHTLNQFINLYFCSI